MAPPTPKPLAWLWDHRNYAVAIAGLLVALVGLDNLAMGETEWGWFSTISGFALALTVLLSRKRRPTGRAAQDPPDPESTRHTMNRPVGAFGEADP